MKLSDRAMMEAGFDRDFSSDRLNRMLEAFSDDAHVTDLVYRIRAEDGFRDLKRGELYPEVIGAGTRLRRVIAQTYGVDDGERNLRAQPNFGCNGCIETIFAAIRNREDAERIRRASQGEPFGRDDFGGCVAATPTYFRYYHAAHAKGVRFIGVPYRDWNEYPVDDVVRTVVESSVSLLILVSPNNPTGVALRDEELDALMSRIPNDVAVIMDRTCVNVFDETPTVELLRRYEGRHFGIFHSFSKYKGMSHLRIGFAVYADEALAEETNRYVPFGLNLEAALKATRILQEHGPLTPDRKIVKNIQNNRTLMQEFLAKRPEYRCSDFCSNYALIRLPKGVTSESFTSKPLERGIFILGGHEFPVSDISVVRVHVGGSPEHLQMLFSFLGK